jgi:hypothetical protein
MSLKLGIAREIITPKVGTILEGFSPGRPCESIADDLTVDAAVFNQDGKTIVLLAMSVLYTSNELTAEVQKAIGGELGIDPSHVILSSSHTHSGPNMSGTRTYAPDLDYINGIFKPGCLKAAKKAFESLRPVKLGINETESTVGVNRRKVLQDGTIILAQNPWGLFDPRMTVLCFVDDDNVPYLNIVHYGAHPNGAGFSKEVTRDWPGVMTDRLEKETGALTMYLQGSEGDVAARIAVNGKDSYGKDRSLAQTIELGGLAGIDAAWGWRGIREFHEVQLSIAEGDIRIPRDPLPPLEQVREKLARGGEPGYVTETLKAIEDLYDRGETGPAFFDFHQTLFSIGPAVFIPFPFEVFSEIFLRLRDYSPFPYTLCMGCTNGSHGYLPTQREIAGGGYEAGVFLFGSPHSLPHDTDTRLINENLKIMDALDNVMYYRRAAERVFTRVE